MGGIHQESLKLNALPTPHCSRRGLLCLLSQEKKCVMIETFNFIKLPDLRREWML